MEAGELRRRFLVQGYVLLPGVCSEACAASIGDKVCVGECTRACLCVCVCVRGGGRGEEGMGEGNG